ncbi:unnamed protein product [Rhizophagus irregularis]|uniref:Carbohydrate-binding module family 19 domain-containing protein n=1 Tax=Rhizophagus irregularis (strain DAOM 197198w) TaxID=1432141 RepID=A0A015KBJ2_RHIIW|nr:hypothetical protein RirG_212360 [Rhizophagus irregularis DAOM 197198w]CAB4464492.1 unnamed protein product [Rhizophagus irregularis]CAB5096693.1 unnamed protein product [Rhizophagus irregularis]CAB5096703.1 unnamed protein product [Rhizophagus irregularis]
MKFQSTLILVALCILSTFSASVTEAKQCFQKQNAREATLLNKKFDKLNKNSPCKTGETVCIKGQVAQCDQGKFVLTSCGPTTECFALPLVNSPGTSIACDKSEDAANRIKLARQCKCLIFIP